VDKGDYLPEALDKIMLELAGHDLPASEMENASAAVHHQVEVHRNRLTGIRGLLLWLIIAILVGSLANAASGLLLLASGQILFSIWGVFFLILAIYGFYVFYVLIRKHTNAPKHAQRLLSLGVFLDITLVLLIWEATHVVDVSPLGGCIGTLVWLGYLTSSERVANTYRRPAPAQDHQSIAATS
jgi:hypothetical protein